MKLRRIIFAGVFTGMALFYTIVFMTLLVNGGAVAPYEPDSFTAGVEAVVFIAMTVWGVIEIARELRVL